ncbi:MFS transporter superfamily protein [Pleurotus pulmonarius]
MSTLEDGSLRTGKTPLPYRQLFIVSLLQGSEPLTSSIIFPFVNQAVRESGITGGDETKTGYYAGAIESIFFIAECLTVVHWGRLSDRIGRKPVMLIGLVGLATSMITFGLSKSYWLLLISRFIQGMSNGNMGMTKNIMAEITDETNIADAFAWMPLIWSVGGTVGPIIGGTLSNPSSTYPSSIFASWPIFVNNPYLLPCMVAAGYSLTCLAIGWFWLDETHLDIVSREKLARSITGDSRQTSSTTSTVPPSESTPLLTPSPSSSSLASSSASSPSSSTYSIRTLLHTPSIVFSLINLAFLAFADQSIQVILPLSFSTPTSLYGLAFPPYTIGVTLGLFGLLNGLYQIFVLPLLTRRFGFKGVHRFAFGVGLTGVLLGYVAIGDGVRIRGEVDRVVWTLIVLLLTFMAQYSMAWGCIYPILIATSPTPSTLATITALGQMATSTMRSVAPSFASSLFAFSMQMREYYRTRHCDPTSEGGTRCDGEWVGWIGWGAGNLVYFVLLGVVALGIWTSGKLPEQRRHSGQVGNKEVNDEPTRRHTSDGDLNYGNQK